MNPNVVSGQDMPHTHCNCSESSSQISGKFVTCCLLVIAVVLHVLFCPTTADNELHSDSNVSVLSGKKKI